MFVHADVRDRSSLVHALRHAPHAYLLAAMWQDDVVPIERYYDVNVDGARNFCDAAEEVGLTRIVFVSSVSIYGPGPREIAEDAEAAPVNHYGKSKLDAEKIFLDWAKRGGDRSLTIVRPTVIFGPGNRGNVYNLIRQLSSGRFVMIGDGKNRKSMCYVENVAAFLCHCLRFGSGINIINYSDKPDFSMNELVAFLSRELERPVGTYRLPLWAAVPVALSVEKLTKAMGGNSRLTRERVRKFCANTQVSVERLRATGFQAPFTLEEGLRRVLEADFSAYQGGATKPPRAA